MTGERHPLLSDHENRVRWRRWRLKAPRGSKNSACVTQGQQSQEESRAEVYFIILIPLKCDSLY